MLPLLSQFEICLTNKWTQLLIPQYLPKQSNIKKRNEWTVAMVAQLSKHSRTDFPSPQRGSELAKLTFKNHRGKEKGWSRTHHPPRLHSQLHVQLNSQLHMCCKDRGFPLNARIKRRPWRHVGVRREKGERKNTQMGKSIRVCEKRSEWLAFPHWSSKGYFTPKSTYWLHALGTVSQRKRRNICWGNLHGIYFLH